ncbi:uncharacterized protein JCM15063_006527 [Sporobolomyces koalae]|uniref:uncharacterized protein n=1 Tax=Sporobolomyces koalae TaxID=500713 RepID=UPI00317A7FEE
MSYEPAFAPHPSYQLEDSSDESDWAEDDLSSERRAREIKPLPREPHVELARPSPSLQQGGRVVFLVGEAGERFAQGMQVDEHELVPVLVDGQQYGAIAPSATPERATIVFLSAAIELSFLHPLAAFLLETLAPRDCTILASYHLPSYIPPATNESSHAFSSRLPLLTLSPSTSSVPALTSLRSNGTLEPYLPPNLLHGLPSSLLTVASLLPEPPATTVLVLVPTTTPPPPLNGPFSHLSPVSQPTVTTMYDAGGPVGLSDPSAQFRQLASDRGKLVQVKQSLGWDWWTPVVAKDSRIVGQGFQWLETARKQKKKEETSSMFL